MADVRTRITAQDKASPVFKKFDKTTEKVRLGISRLRNRMLLASFATGLLGFAFKKIISVANAQEVAEAKLNKTLESTGFAAELTSSQLRDMASGLQQLTTFGDEAIIPAQALLLTFTKIGKEAFPRAIELALDLSVAMGQDLKSSVVQIGKALNDPIQGITALSRVGIQFTDVQKAQIKSLTQQNKLFEAQTIIMNELTVQFGGQAQEQAKTFSGQVTQMANAFGDLVEEIGFFLTRSQTMQGIIRTLKGAFEGLTDAITGVTQEMRDQVDSITDTNKSAEELLNLEQELEEAVTDTAVSMDFLKEMEDNANKSLMDLGKETFKFTTTEAEATKAINNTVFALAKLRLEEKDNLKNKKENKKETEKLTESIKEQKKAIDETGFGKLFKPEPPPLTLAQTEKDKTFTIGKAED